MLDDKIDMLRYLRSLPGGPIIWLALKLLSIVIATPCIDERDAIERTRLTVRRLIKPDSSALVKKDCDQTAVCGVFIRCDIGEVRSTKRLAHALFGLVTVILF